MAVVSTSDLTPAATYQDLMERCERRLREIANQDNDTILTAAGGILALVRPDTLLESGQPMNQAAHIYANYLVSRNLAMAVALLAMLVLRARGTLAGLMVLVAIVQLVDAIGDATTGRASLLPIILVFAIAFLLGASRLSGHPFWQAAAWRDTVGTVDPPS